MERQAIISSNEWQGLETILLDMDGTLLDLAFDNYFWLDLVPKAYAKKHKLEPEQADQFLNDLYQKHHGTLEWYCTDFWSKKMELDIIALKDEVSEKVEYRDGTLAFLETAKQHGKKLYLVTNAHPDTLAIKLKARDFTKYFDDLITSHQMGYPKEDLKFWLAIEEKWKFNKNTTLFVDDSVSILATAKKFGIKNVIGISHPDSSRGHNSVEPFTEVNQLTEIIKL